MSESKGYGEREIEVKETRKERKRGGEDAEEIDRNERYEREIERERE